MPGEKKAMMLGIRKRMALGFIFIIVITVVVLEALIINIVRSNYYRNLESSLYNQVSVSCELYLRYFSDTSLTDNVLNNVDSFWRQTNAQVEVIDANGRVLMDSIGYLPDDFGIMAVSKVLQADGRTIGVLRFITTVKEVDEDVYQVSRVFIVIGLIVTAASVALCFLLSNSIVNPIQKVNEVAAKMASGDFSVRVKKIYNDEIGKLSDTLNYMADEIDKRDTLKNEFISSISHELRTPLTSIKGWAVTLMETGSDDKELFDTGLDIIEKESDRLTMMVEELLDFSRLVSGKMTMRNEQVKLGTAAFT